jgi:hypothetical protein
MYFHHGISPRTRPAAENSRRKRTWIKAARNQHSHRRDELACIDGPDES